MAYSACDRYEGLLEKQTGMCTIIMFLCNLFGGFNFIPDWEVSLSVDIFVLNILLEKYSMNIRLSWSDLQIT